MLGSDYSIADIAIRPWVNNLIGFYGAGELVGFADFANVKRVLDAFLARPAVGSATEDPARDLSTASMSSSSALAPRRRRCGIRGTGAAPDPSTRSR